MDIPREGKQNRYLWESKERNWSKMEREREEENKWNIDKGN